MKARFLTAIVLLALPSTVWASDETPVDKGSRGKFVQAGAAFACVLPPELPAASDGNIEVCLWMGRYAVGMNALKLQELGDANRVIQEPNGTVHIAYTFDAQVDDTTPYFLASVLNGRIVALQVTGERPIKGFSFQEIDLGTPEADVLRVFGKPKQVTPGPDDATKLWSYLPWTFSFEVRGGRVVSIRLGKPG